MPCHQLTTRSPTAAGTRSVISARGAWTSTSASARLTASISRCAGLVSPKPQLEAARAFKELAARHAQVRELLPLGAYVAGADPATDRAVQLYPRMEAFLRQGTTEAAPMAEVERQLLELMA